jgi:hypothetical protein
MLPEAHEMFVRLSSAHSVAAFMLCCCGVIGTFGIEKVAASAAETRIMRVILVLTPAARSSSCVMPPQGS